LFLGAMIVVCRQRAVSIRALSECV
jgi:hypothetical protein